MKQLKQLVFGASFLALGILVQVIRGHPIVDGDWSKCVEGSDVFDSPDCPDEDPEHPVYFPFPYNCRQYYQCSNNIANCLHCAPGTVWDHKNLVCNHEAVTNCTIYSTIPPATSTLSTFRPPKTTEDPTHWICPDAYYGPIRHPFNCSEYYVCNPPHEPTKQSCSAQLYFHPVAEYCDYPMNVPDCVDGTPPAPTRTTPSTDDVDKQLEY